MDVNNIEERIGQACNLLKALSNEKRLLVMCTLRSGEKSVGALEEVVDLSQSALSQHLARLRRDGLVKTRREAQTIYYSICCEDTFNLLNHLCERYGFEQKK